MLHSQRRTHCCGRLLFHSAPQQRLLVSTVGRRTVECATAGDAVRPSARRYALTALSTHPRCTPHVRAECCSNGRVVVATLPRAHPVASLCRTETVSTSSGGLLRAVHAATAASCGCVLRCRCIGKAAKSGVARAAQQCGAVRFSAIVGLVCVSAQVCVFVCDGVCAFRLGPLSYWLLFVCL